MLSWDETSNITSQRWESSADWLRQRAWVEIDVGAIAHNVRQIKHLLSPKCDLMAVVKADAYGHGAVTVSQTVLSAGASWLGVATIPEGMELREAGIKAPILVLGATYSPEQIRAMAKWELMPTICTPQQALVFSETLGEDDASATAGAVRDADATPRGVHPLPVHVKLDTGMSRLGVSYSEADAFVQLIRSLPNLKIASIYSHLATADSQDQTVMRQQQARFEQAIGACNHHGSLPRLHFANSAATFTDPSLHYDMVRVGLGIYGLYPAPHLRPVVDLKPVMQVKARITQVKNISAGTGVSYGHQYIAKQPMRLAVVGIGYADGVPRCLSNHMKVLIRGQLLPQVGTITMDQMMVDVTAVPEVQPGEVVTLLGRQGDHQIGADDWAAICGTISWEILCSFKHRLPRLTVSRSLETRPEKARY
ncbi:MAG TPA: alanine racemase [Oscillatoriaceae cyanobacterium M33_DOE_052]|uniref:Alanine racemase n=1 Tax=Planktothricoides sp. SpSt-374 TaxID=2282167 RepID=A0A7C3ZX28_9CYAN|nr:alanine racemase [Oscillatoriaceae cyanobacterium M33_DOE_052]